MANLKEVKNRINSVQSTQQITKAMKMVAAAKLRRAQDKIIELRPYAQKLDEILGNLGGEENTSSPYYELRDINKVLIIAISSDKGLCGAFNSNVFKTTNRLIEDKYQSLFNSGNVDILPLGKRSFEFFSKRDYSVISDYYEIFSDLSFEKARTVAEFAMNKFASGDYDRVHVVYNEFKNVATQILKTDQLLPIDSSVSDDNLSAVENDYIFEPNRNEILEDLIPRSVKIKFFKSVLESNASEHGARMTAMDKATDNANELLKELKLTYNRTRQAAITTEILEIVGGAEALSNG
ncbi:MAG: ATP synthase F1 subunit gamma [Bacteroidota bacterium]